jgi:TPR repeat protein
MPPSRAQLRLLRERAEAGDAWSQNKLGMINYLGEGVAQKYSEAARLFRLVADQGNAQSQNMLANCYILGQGVPQDLAEGFCLCTLAAEQGHAHAQIHLASMNRAAGAPAVAVPRDAARSLARTARSDDPQVREAGLVMLGKSSNDRSIARTCCIGCGKTEQLQVCAKCMTAKFCSRECQRRMWPAHKPACQAWREQKAAAAAEAGGASSSALAGSGEAEDEEAKDDVASLPA